MGVLITNGTAWEDTGCTLMARVLGNAGTAINQASISSIARKVFDLNSSTPETPVSSTTPTVADVVFDALQTDARWTTDSTGYNFRETVAASVLAEGDRRYRVEYVLTPASGEKFNVVFEIQTRKLIST